MKELVIDADIAKLDEVLAFVDAELEAAECTMKVQMQLDIAVEEIYVNIAHYAYGEGQGQATIQMETEPGQTMITFIDSGMPYNPLEKEDPDITLPASERPIGGLGIYMVKKSMDDVTYEHRDGNNVLTITKKW
ncbi:MAG: ATP-binding protein [Eubacterium sp.]|nr:ATP-binding protein [Eubacterium sp.]